MTRTVVVVVGFVDDNKDDDDDDNDNDYDYDVVAHGDDNNGCDDGVGGDDDDDDNDDDYISTIKFKNKSRWYSLVAAYYSPLRNIPPLRGIPPLRSILLFVVTNTIFVIQR